MEKVLWLIECVKIGSWSFVLEISCWRMVHVWVDQLKVDSDQIETLIENNWCSTTREIVDVLKVSKSINLLVKNEKYLILWKKLKLTFWPTQYICWEVCNTSWIWGRRFVIFEIFEEENIMYFQFLKWSLGHQKANYCTPAFYCIVT